MTYVLMLKLSATQLKPSVSDQCKSGAWKDHIQCNKVPVAPRPLPLGNGEKIFILSRIRRTRVTMGRLRTEAGVSHT